MPFLLLISGVHVDCDAVNLLFRFITDDHCSHKYVLLKTGRRRLRIEELGETWLRRRKPTKGCTDKW
jgi:hypothetical protein